MTIVPTVMFDMLSELLGLVNAKMQEALPERKYSELRIVGL